MIESTALKFGFGSTVNMVGSGVMALPTGVNSIDKISQINVVASAANLVFTLPNPINSIGQVVYICNVGANSFTMYNKSIQGGTTARFQWTGSAWQPEIEGRLPIPPTPILTVQSGATTITGQFLSLAVSGKDSVTFNLRVVINTPVHNSVWQALRVPTITGYQNPIITVCGTYRQSGSPTGFPPAPCMVNEATVWISNLIYVGGFTENQATNRNLTLHIIYYKS